MYELAEPYGVTRGIISLTTLYISIIIYTLLLAIS